jgi:tetratricopeptide (TPR) repeat protein/predicted Ser/Thr protein kinase
MDPEAWTRVQAIFHQAVELADPDRRAFVHASCGGDDEIESTVLGMLEEDAHRESLLDEDVARLAGHVLESNGASPVPLRSVGRYVLTRRLGEGGTGVVYLAERDDLSTLVAIKLLRDAWVSPSRRERFAAEQRTLAHLSHPSIARFYDADTLDDGTPWIAMEYVRGVTLTDYSRAQAATARERLRLFHDVCEAVHHAHQRLVIHRDLKPSNILVTDEGHVKLLDFGIAKQLEDLGTPVDQTKTLLRVMTPGYAAPEQIRGERVGVYTDVYALGVVLYELLAGRPPFDLSNRSARGAESVVLEREPEKPSLAGRASPDAAVAGGRAWNDLDVLCLTAMHKEPARRYRTVEALIRDVDHFLNDEPLDARGDSIAYRTGKFLARNWRVAVPASAALALVIGLVAFYTVQLEQARNAALAEAARTQRIQRFIMQIFAGGEHDAAPANDLRVVTLVDRGAQEAHSLAGEPAVQAELYETLGTIYQYLGSHDQADALLSLALDRRRAILGADHADVADSMVALGLLRVDQAKLEEAERLVRQGLTQSERALPVGHPGLARATAALGKVLRERGDYDQATRVLDRAVHLYSALPSPSPELAATMTSLANTHFYLGHLDKSEVLNRRVLDLDRRSYGPRHPSVADDLLNLAAIESVRGRYGEAERYDREALDIFLAWYGPEHPETASARTILAQALMYQAKYADARDLLRQALATQTRVYGVEHPRVAFALNELGSVAIRSNELDEAERSFGRALEIYRKVYNGKHYRVGVALVNLAGVFVARRNYARAERLFGEAVTLYAEVLPADHQNVAVAQLRWGRALVQQKRHEQAERHLAEAYRILMTQRQPPAALVQAAREDLFRVYDALGQPDKGEKLARAVAAAAARP